ncbi:diguanylate cyclase (GGDEF)-like protein [Natronospira proteinivora]|uniref:Diguanylate cyclase (GGDEF)-like protein n=1 Tax=Natronospira proteinivora TaxID=1807133 RepID=A0ABT1GB85_9GAMM|nr:bifunctional diguanylate cyclase/phosphodiesterase [Natronospira proteinivora]MCP1728307.1 diguanylate cyclase (GGDEF)-like protein [Natronospira proteinivora]
MELNDYLSRRRPGIYALSISLTYLVLAVTWIGFSDQWVARLADEPETVSQLQTLKGIFFVVATATMLFLFTYWTGQSLLQANRMDQWSRRDPLTGLASRVQIMEILKQGLAHREHKGGQLAVIILDVAQLRRINESFGVAAGDAALLQLAHRLRHEAGPNISLGRPGAGQFVAIVQPPCETEMAISWAERLLQVTREAVQVGGRAIRLRLDAGIALAPDDGDDPQTLIQRAHTAVFRAKKRENPSVCFASELQSGPSQQSLKLESDLGLALKRKQFQLLYQPIVNALDGRIEGCEALIRWEHPEMGLIPPNRFIPLLEQSGQIVDVGAWVIDQSLAQLRRVADPALSMSINLSRRQLWDSSLTGTLEAACRRHHVDRRKVCLEVTESLAMHDPAGTSEMLRELQQIGYSLAMDDFGSGYSCLAYLKQYPLDILKIDRAFVSGVPEDQGNRDLLEIIIHMAKRFKLKTVAEGVETETECRTLQTLGCDFLQGYWLARPLTGEGLEALMVRHNGYLSLEPSFRNTLKRTASP